MKQSETLLNATYFVVRVRLTLLNIVILFYPFFSWPLRRCIINHEQKIVMCAAAKAACTTWRLLMMISSEKFSKKYPKWKNINSVTKEIIKQVSHPKQRFHQSFIPYQVTVLRAQKFCKVLEIKSDDVFYCLIHQSVAFHL